ncbi:MAG: hypothetical protein ABSG86_20485 [Thermoguttaceae bacterium]|jgi:hypothetical protein
MTWSDPIVDEVRRVRDEYAARFNYDLRAIYRDLKAQEVRSGRKIVSYAESSARGEQSIVPRPASPAQAVRGSVPPQRTQQAESAVDS